MLQKHQKCSLKASKTTFKMIKATRNQISNFPVKLLLNELIIRKHCFSPPFFGNNDLNTSSTHPHQEYKSYSSSSGLQVLLILIRNTSPTHPHQEYKSYSSSSGIQVIHILIRTTSPTHPHQEYKSYSSSS